MGDATEILVRSGGRIYLVLVMLAGIEYASRRKVRGNEESCFLPPVGFRRDASTGWVEITAGQDRFCRRSDAGVLSCWNRFGPTFAPSDPVSAAATGALHACARLATTGKVICWGENGDVQLGGYGVFGEPVEVVGQP